MSLEMFDIKEFNVISDDDFYYVFRALNNGDKADIEKGIITDKEELTQIRTDRERWEEINGIPSRFAQNSEVSLEEIIAHCKAVNHSKETNCISITCNANIALGYGQEYSNNYVMIKIPKNKETEFIETGRYALNEIEGIIEKEIENLPKDGEIYKRIKAMENQSTKEMIENVVSAFKKVKSEGNYTGKNVLEGKGSIQARFERKQIFSEEQQQKYTEILGKLTVLEIYGKISPILENTRDNSLLLKTVGAIFSNTEILHYGAIDSSKFVKISKEMMDIMALIQQVKDDNRDSQEIKILESKVLDLVQKGYELKEDNGKLTLANGTDKIDLNLSNDNILLNEDIKNKEFGIEDIYKITRRKNTI